jgi:hypothetical protein
MISRAVSFAILVLFFANGAFAQNFGNGVALDQVGGAVARQTLTINGLIRNNDGRPAKDARIEIHSRQNGQVVAYCYANANGSFEINLPRGF